MDLEQLRQFLTQNRDSDEIKSVIGDLGFTPKTEVKFDDTIKGLLETDEEAKRYLDSIKDSHFTKSLNTWKSNNLDSLIEQEVKKRFPETSPEAIKLQELERKIQETENKARIAELKAKARDVARERGLPHEFIDRFLGDDETSTLKNIEEFEKVWTSNLTKAVEAKMAGNHRDPNKEQGGDNTKTFTNEEILKMDSDTLRKNWGSIQKALKKQ